MIRTVVFHDSSFMIEDNDLVDGMSGAQICGFLGENCARIAAQRGLTGEWNGELIALDDNTIALELTPLVSKTTVPVR